MTANSTGKSLSWIVSRSSPNSWRSRTVSSRIVSYQFPLRCTRKSMPYSSSSGRVSPLVGVLQPLKICSNNSRPSLITCVVLDGDLVSLLPPSPCNLTWQLISRNLPLCSGMALTNQPHPRRNACMRQALVTSSRHWATCLRKIVLPFWVHWVVEAPIAPGPSPPRKAGLFGAGPGDAMNLVPPLPYVNISAPRFSDTDIAEAPRNADLARVENDFLAQVRNSRTGLPSVQDKDAREENAPPNVAALDWIVLAILMLMLGLSLNWPRW